MNWNDGNVFFLADFDDGMESSIILPLIRQIQHQRTLRYPRIDLHINSHGGYKHLVFQLVSLVEMAKRDDITVRTIVSDVAYSAGSVLAIAGTPGERYIEPTAEHLIHYGLTGSMETTPEQLERNFQAKNFGFKKIRAHYLKYSQLTAEELDRLMNDDSAYINARKSIKAGLADHYTTKFDIGYTHE